MKSGSVMKIFSILLFCSIITFAQAKNDHVLFQTSPITALLNGVMNDNYTIGMIKRHGNFGLGTFNGVDGEMIFLNGKVYRVNNEGKVTQPDNKMKTPFTTELYFHADTVFQLKGNNNLSQLESFIGKWLPSKNYIYAIKISGDFQSVKARSEAKQTKPYSSLSDVLKNQSIFNLKNIKGTMVGFYFPDYLQTINAPGYHFHFISFDKKSGGHALDFTSENVKIEIETIHKIEMNLPEGNDFRNAKLNKSSAPGL